MMSDEAPPEEKKDKASRKAEKALRRAERKAARKSVAPAIGTPSEGKKDKTRRKAKKKLRKAERKKTNPSPDKPAELRSESGVKESPEDRKDKAARKAKRASKRAQRKTEKQLKVSPGAAAASGSNAAPDDSFEKHEFENAADKPYENREDEEGEQTRQSGAKRDDLSRPLGISLNGLDETIVAKLRTAIGRHLAGVPVDWSASKRSSGIAIYGFDNPSISATEISSQAAAIAKDGAKLRIFLEPNALGRDGGEESMPAEKIAVAQLAGSFNSPLIQQTAKLDRYGEVADFAGDILAPSILGLDAVRRFLGQGAPRPQLLAPADLADARALAATPREFIAQLQWNSERIPKSLWTRAPEGWAEAFADRKIILSEDLTLDANVPIVWPKEISGRSAANVYGLGFLAGPLNYWYNKASGGRPSKDIAETDAVLKERGVTASQVLAQSGAIIVDFARAYPASSSTAWDEASISGRARILALYVLCCKAAIKRKIKIDEAICSAITLHLLELIELLRSEDFYTPCSLEGIGLDRLIISLAIVLRGTPYADRLLKDGVERLKTLQLDACLTADGVWRFGSFSDHCAALSQFGGILSELGDADKELILDPIAGAVKKMTAFAEAMQKFNGTAPAFDGSGERSFARNLSGTRRVLAGAGFSKAQSKNNVTPPRLTDTYVFRDAQYFVSHSTQKVVPESSLVILHADPVSFARSSPGGIAVAFSYGPSDLLVRAEPPEGTNRRDREKMFDPALLNGYHINGAGFLPRAELKPGAARLQKSWRGPGWAAARAVNEINPFGSITRTVIHLKAEHALIVVDDLATPAGEQASFEQFWHLAPGLTLSSPDEPPHRFMVGDSGGMTVAFDALAGATVEPEGEGLCLRRVFSMAHGVTAAVFRWSTDPTPLALEVGGENSQWNVHVAGAGLDARIECAEDELRYVRP